MYFVKKLHGEQEKHRPIDWGPFWRQLDFQELINYQERKDDLGTIRAGDHQSLPPDLAAAVHAHLDYRIRSLGGPSTALDRVAGAALHYCELMLYERDYIPASSSQLTPCEKTGNLFLMAGTQARDILQSRVQAGVKLLQEMVAPVDATIVFSGKNPADASFGRTQTPDEAVQMETLFNKAVANHRIPKEESERWTTTLENKSINSIGNIENTLDPNFLCTFLQDSIWLYIVSSTFHLPRLTNIAENLIKERDLKKIKQIIAVSAEDEVESDPVVVTARYLKWMMFVVYDHILTRSPRAALADSERSLS